MVNKKMKNLNSILTVSETKIFAHKKSQNYEKLQHHLNLTVKESYRNGLNEVSYYLAEKLNINSKKVLELCEDMIFFHDIAKAQPYFQQHKMSNTISGVVENNTELSKHAQLSAHIYFSEHLNLIKNLENKEKYYVLLLVLTEVIAKHHSNLTNLEDCMSQLQNFLKTVVDDKHIFSYFKNDYSKIYNYNKLVDKYLSMITKDDAEIIFASGSILYAILSKSDIVATKMFMNNENYDEDVYDKRSKSDLLKSYQRSDLSNFLREYYEKNSGEINSLNDARNEIALNATETMRDVDLGNRFFYLEAGVGSGKTHLSTRFIINTLMSDNSIDKVIQALPLLALSEQTYKYIKDIENTATRVDSTTDIPYVYKDDFSLVADYPKMVFNHQMHNYKSRVITFVQLFKIMFGRSKKDALKRLSLSNSVIVLDELQTIDVSLFKQFSSTIKIMAEILNFKVLFMSATLPKSDINAVDLVDPDKFRNNPYLNRRNVLNFSYFKGYNQIEVLENIDISGKRVLVHCITKKKAGEVYDKLKHKYKNVRLFTSDVDKSERFKIVEELQEQKGNQYACKEMILVATNAIEAGVDISMNIAIVDYTMIDSLEQLSGRVNRNNTFNSKDSKIYVINNENGGFLSKIKVGLSATFSDAKINYVFKSKNYTEYMTTTIELSEKTKEYKKQKLSIERMCFKDVSEQMELITDDSLEYYDIRDSVARELEAEYRYYSGLMRESYVDYDKNYIKRLEILKKLEKYKVVLTAREDKQALINEFGDIRPIFKK